MSTVRFKDINNDNYISFTLFSKASEMPVYSYADINNDGFDDIIVIEQVKKDDAYPVHVLWGHQGSQKLISSSYSFNLDAKPKRLFVSDINGNGLNDLFIVTENGYNFIRNNGRYENKNGIVSVDLKKSGNGTLFSSNNSVLEDGDFNGDGLIDFIVNETNTSNWFFAINSGGWSFTKNSLSAITASEENFTGKNDGKEKCVVSDFNNDGKDDVIIIESDYEKKHSKWPSSGTYGRFRSSYVDWYISSGTNIELNKRLQTDTEDYSYSTFIVSGDFDGDGKSDLLSYSANLYSDVEKNLDNFYLHRSDNSFGSGLIKSIADGNNNILSFEYKPLTDASVYTTSSYVDDYSVFRLKDPLYVISKSSFGNGNNISSKVYSYKNGIVHMNGKGFLGFLTSTTKDLQTNTESELTQTYNSDFKTLLASSTKTTVSGLLVKSAKQDISLLKQEGKCFVQRLNYVKESDLLTNVTVTKELSNYDSYGNPQTIISDYGDGISDKQEITYIQ